MFDAALIFPFTGTRLHTHTHTDSSGLDYLSAKWVGRVVSLGGGGGGYCEKKNECETAQDLLGSVLSKFLNRPFLSPLFSYFFLLYFRFSFVAAIGRRADVLPHLFIDSRSYTTHSSFARLFRSHRPHRPSVTVPYCRSLLALCFNSGRKLPSIPISFNISNIILLDQ